ncbi:hypothetical protein MNBD_NITROSPINAE02-198 [hydrothermal vent metagenome]|uniref:SHSP domain-containing protein n=1 Tax=hydrothermal vent metagenome TaxID=652676 RepID=A0A3B1BW53_9ZZZZ
MGSGFWKKSGQVFIVREVMKRGAGAFLEQTDQLGETCFVPMDVYETKDAFVWEMDIPGITVSDITIAIRGETLAIEGIKKDVIDQGEKVNYLCMERKFGPIRRLVKLPAAIDKNNITASFDKGTLTIKAPKVIDRRKSARQITIE